MTYFFICNRQSFGFLLFPTTQHQTAYLSEVRICFSWNLSYIDCQYKQSHVVDITLTSNDLCPDEFIFPPWTTTWTYFCRFVYGLLGLISFCVLLRLLLSWCFCAFWLVTLCRILIWPWRLSCFLCCLVIGTATFHVFLVFDRFSIRYVHFLLVP